MYHFDSVYNKSNSLQTIGRPMRLTYLILFFAISAFGENSPRIQVLPNPQSLEDFDHEFKGCPENSECDQVMGHMLTNWRSLVTKLYQAGDSQKTALELEIFKSKYGIPVEFYTDQKSQQSFRPALNSSSCKQHNPKTGPKTFRAVAFLKSLTNEKAIIWRDQSQIELPLKDNLVPQPVKVYYETGAVTYQLPINDQPLFIKNKELYILREDEGLYYTLKISENGDWKIVHIDMTQLSTLEERRQYVDCPKENEKPALIFGIEFCKSVWDLEAKKTVIVKMHQGCAI